MIPWCDFLRFRTMHSEFIIFWHFYTIWFRKDVLHNHHHFPSPPGGGWFPCCYIFCLRFSRIFLLFPIAREVFGGLPQPPDLTHQCATWPKGLSLVAQILGFAGWHGFSEERGWGLDGCWGLKSWRDVKFCCFFVVASIYRFRSWSPSEIWKQELTGGVYRSSWDFDTHVGQD